MSWRGKKPPLVSTPRSHRTMSSSSASDIWNSGILRLLLLCVCWTPNSSNDCRRSGAPITAHARIRINPAGIAARPLCDGIRARWSGGGGRTIWIFCVHMICALKRRCVAGPGQDARGALPGSQTMDQGCGHLLIVPVDDSHHQRPTHNDGGGGGSWTYDAPAGWCSHAVRGLSGFYARPCAQSRRWTAARAENDGVSEFSVRGHRPCCIGAE